MSLIVHEQSPAHPNRVSEEDVRVDLTVSPSESADSERRNKKDEEKAANGPDMIIIFFL